uniref:Uncharacterized protein n=1 Tax=Oryza sativa subsp. japonica TaxID=39947 RepID=Q6ERX3_ORYSJ|nr:hypothetical protein [Oryza sativa Japonica Group]BAD28597.1 hypothetical protein [Oryza sativa Japonica Group]
MARVKVGVLIVVVAMMVVAAAAARPAREGAAGAAEAPPVTTTTTAATPHAFAAADGVGSGPNITETTIVFLTRDAKGISNVYDPTHWL